MIITVYSVSPSSEIQAISSAPSIPSAPYKSETGPATDAENEPETELETDPATDSTTEATEDTEKSQDSEVDLEETLEMPLFPASMAPMGTGPVSLSINESPVDKYADLDSAFTVLENTPSVTSAVVEITEAGEYPSSSFSFNGFNLIIRGATGIRPEITMDDESIQFSGATLTIQNVDLSMSNDLQDYTFGIGKDESASTIVTLNDTNLRLDGKNNTTKFAIQFFSKSDNVTLNIVNQSEVFVTGYKGSNPGNAIYTESENIKTVNITDSTFISDGNRSGWIASGTGDKLLAVNVTGGVLEVINSTGNGSNGGNVNVSEGSLVTFNDNFDNGLSVNWLKVNDSTVKVGRNGANGIVARTGLWVENSEITVIENKEKLISKWTQPGGIYLNQSTDTVSTIDGQSTVSILGNSGPGLHLYQGSLIVAEGAMLTVKDNKAYDVREDGLYAKGAGVYLRSGTLVLPKSAVIYNNRAANEADDIFVAAGQTLTFHQANRDRESWVLNEEPEWDENHVIDGWYVDQVGNRWSAHVDPVYIDEFTSYGDTPINGPLSLKAAHRLLLFTEVAVEKIWVGEVGESVTIKLLANGEEIDTVDLSEDNKWKYIFNDLPSTNIDDEAIEYTVEEVKIEGYESKITGSQEDGFTVTNTYLIPMIDIVGTKTWVGGETLDPEAVFTLLANGQPARHLGEFVNNVYVPGALVDPITLGYEDTEIKFTNLPKTTLDGLDIVYTIEEETLEGFQVVKEGNDFTNLFVIEPIDLVGTKTWIGGEEFDPEAVFTLLANGQPARHLGEYEDNVYVPGALVEAVTLGFTDTEIKFSNLPKTTVDGVEIVYTMVEAPVADFETTQDGFNFINEFVGEVESDKVFKVEFEKSANKTTYTKLDEVIKYTFTLKNTGELDYINVEIYDDTLKRVVLKVDVLKPQETVTETIEYKVTQADIDRKFITNVATVTGECTDCLTDPTPIVDSVTVNYKPELPDTGDNSRMISLIGTLFILGGALVLKRRKED